MSEAGLRYHWLRLRSVAHPTEDVGRVRLALANVAGLAPDELGEGLTVSPAETHHGGTLQVLEWVAQRSRPIRGVLGRLLDVPGLREELAATAEARVDDDGVLYLRLDKQEAFQGRLALTRGEDCVQVRLRFETYPASREAAVAAARRLAESGRP